MEDRIRFFTWQKSAVYKGWGTLVTCESLSLTFDADGNERVVRGQVQAARPVGQWSCTHHLYTHTCMHTHTHAHTPHTNLKSTMFAKDLQQQISVKSPKLWGKKIIKKINLTEAVCADIIAVPNTSKNTTSLPAPGSFHFLSSTTALAWVVSQYINTSKNTSK